MIRTALWWLDDHRAHGAIVLAGLVALGLVVATAGSDPSSGEPRAQLGAALAGGLMEEAQRPGGIKPSPKANVKVSETARERVERAGESGGAEIGGEVDRLPKPTRCSGEANGAVVDVSVMGPGCEAAGELVDTYRSGIGSAQPRTVGDITCAPVRESLQVSCSRPTDAMSATLLFGPGGPGLTDCGQSPVGEAAAISRVRAAGLSCNAARRRIFAAVSAEEPTKLDGLICEERSIAAVETVSCEADGASIAFTLPAGR